MSWTDDRVDVLKKLWTEGRTASEIAKELGGVTRNAVIGKVHRLGLSGRPSPIKRRTKKAEAKRSAALKTKKTATTVTPIRKKQEIFIPADGGAELLELKESMCKWPIGDPKTSEFRFCGQKKTSGIPYCEHHAAVAYQGSKRKKILQSKKVINTKK